MKFHFSKNLEYQIEAIESVVRLFDTGNNTIQDAGLNETFSLHSIGGTVSNTLDISADDILKNLQSVQKENKIPKIDETLSSMDFSVEMETGTGKTYVYLRTALELSRCYGVKKFIIIVPSVAIREGVLKTFEQTKEHFRELYGTGIGYFSYDSSKLARVREFAQSPDIQIMIMTIQSFNNDTRVLRQTDRDDTYNERSFLDLIAKTNPVVIMDEPQNMESELSKAAITDLNPLIKLRYSATHKNLYNLVYRLTPADAYRAGLVKKIEVFGVKEDDTNALVFDVKDIVVQKGKSPKARVVVENKNAAGDFELKEILFSAGDDVGGRTNNDKYKDLIVSEIDARKERVELSNNTFYGLEKAIDEDREAVFRTQIKETIKTHFDKQERFGKDIKVLSLFFIDKVGNYISPAGIIKKIFNEEFGKLKKSSKYFSNRDVSSVQAGYFASKKEKGEKIFKDTTGKTASDKEVYDLIMKDKERLLSFDEPVSFIFSHSALKEGWDNPNVFQICTLNETSSTTKKRQEIGRGLRLPVDVSGERIFDPQINILTVVANESYKEFVRKLQGEYTEAGYKEAPSAANKRGAIDIKFKKHLAVDNEDFKNLWKRIKKRTQFNIELQTSSLIDKVVEKVNELNIKTLVVRVEKVIVDFDKEGKVKTIYENNAAGERLGREIKIGNITKRISGETGLTIKTITEILSKVSNLQLIFKNPEEYTRSVVTLTKHTLNELVINEGLKYLPTGDVWEMSLFDDFRGYRSKTIESNKSIYDRVAFDSDGEREFAQNLDANPRVTLFTKLPSNFVIDTPLGGYTPDWAIVINTDEGEKLYLVRETKFVQDIDNLRPSEEQKIKCGQKHFDAIGGIGFAVSKNKYLSDLI